MVLRHCGRSVTFQDDLKIGSKAEDDLLEKLRQAFPLAFRAEGLHPDFDIEIPELKKTIELKFDPCSQDTGNIVIEYFHNKPSAFSVSQADYWVIDTGEEVLWLTRERILECILSWELNPVNIHGAGDRYSKWVFLIPLKLLREYKND